MSNEPQPVATVLVGAEGAAEIANESWQRPATEVERRQFITERCKSDEERFNNSLVDGTGRPYWLLTILETAPESVQVKAKQYARCVRLTD